MVLLIPDLELTFHLRKMAPIDGLKLKQLPRNKVSQEAESLTQLGQVVENGQTRNLFVLKGL